MGFDESMRQAAEALPDLNPKDESDFAIVFRIQLKLKPEAFCEIEFLAIFETEEPAPETFKESHFPKLNAPAIDYPYLRAFVSQFGADVYVAQLQSL